ncbi:MAG: NUDIX domain-containing protein [Armatimonadetes bacterium]|nr:NUDIX domain-containing protein [Armatimonadota bacterium]
MTPLSRDVTVAVFTVRRGRVLLHYHARLGMWLPPGGHIEPNELPDEAAVRETLEEAGIAVGIAGEKALPLDYPRQLYRPEGIQLEDIAPGHQHIDLIYFARPLEADPAIPPELAGRDRVGWYAPEEMEAMGVNEEIRRWCKKAVETLDRLDKEEL